jgi:hypothetical protein
MEGREGAHLLGLGLHFSFVFSDQSLLAAVAAGLCRTITV